MNKWIPKFIFYFFITFSSILKAQQVTIIESQQIFGHTMDTTWLYIATSLGFNGTIYPQNILDSTSFFSYTDILIVASGVNTLQPNQVQNIEQFVLQGGDLYLQSEYMQAYSTNQAFSTIVNNLGGGFSWIADISGDLNPMNVLGSLGTTPNAITPLSYYWYGVSGSPCSNVDAFLEYQGQYFGFVFCPGSPGVGKIITTTDQDWIRTSTVNDLNLGANIVSFLADSSSNCASISFPVLNLGNDTTFCIGDSIILNAGSGFNSYLWQNGSTDSVLSVSSSGTYFISVTTPCNTYIDTVVVVTIPCNAVPSVMLLSSDTTFCDKKCIDFTDLSTNNPVSWQWSFPGAVPSNSTSQNPANICYNAYGSFDVTLIACNAAGCDTLFLPSFITEYPLPPQPVISQGNDTLYCTPAFSYSWYNTSNPGIVISSDPFFTTSSGGSYFVIISDSLGCQNSSSVFMATGLDHYHTGDLPVEVFPNPAYDVLHIRWPHAEGQKTRVQLLTLMGQEIFTDWFYSNESRLDIRNLARGMYMVRLSNKDASGSILITVGH